MTVLTFRTCSDFVMWSHVAFGVAIVQNVLRNFHECNLFVVPTVLVSLLYHRYYEVNRRVARMQMFCMATLYLYGLAQLYFVHHPLLFFSELACAFFSALFLYTSVHFKLSLKQYDEWNPLGMHIVPALWAFLVSCYHGSILSIPYISTIPNDMFVFSFGIENDYWHREFT